MNGEPTKVLDGQSDQKVSQPDQNELNSQSNLKYSECLTNGRSCQNSPKLDNPEEDVELAEKVSEDSNTNLENPKAPNSTNESEVLHNKVSNQDDATDTLKENTDTTDTLKENTDPTDTLKENTDVLTAEDSPELLPDNSDKSLGNTESLDNNSTDSQEMINENNDSVHTGKETDTTNGIESDHNSDDEACQYVDDAEDPISSGEPKEVERNIIEKSDSQESETGTFKIVTINRYHSDDENPSDSSGSEDEPRADTVSITTDGEDSRDNGKLKTIDIITLENDQTDNQNGSKSPEIHEIRSDNSDNDDCVVTAVEKVPKTAKKSKSLKNTPTSELRRSSRAIKRKKYEDIEDVDDEESDLEEVVIEDPLQGKSSFASNRKSLVNIATKLKRKIVQKKDDVIVIIDSPVKNRTPATKASNTLHQNIYQKIAAHGTSMTPISSKNVETKSTATQATPEPVLPTLTDDMFVVEAPSFIVPYVYEKPATVPFKEFVEKLGKEIEEERAKEEQELLEKKKAEKAKREQERKEKQERGEEVQESEEEDSDEVKKKKAEKAERKERRRRKKEDDDVSWDGSSSEESDDETISDDETRSKENVINDIKDIVPPPPPKTDSYFDLCLGKFFMDIGSNLVQEYVQADLLHQQNRKLYREKKAGHSTKIRQVSIAQLTKNLELSRKTNASFTFEQKKCKFCSFKTESALALDHHLETPHMKNNVYSCNFCVFDTPSPHNMLFHLDNSHAKKGRLDRPSALHQCVNCPFEDHGKGKLARHVISCAKKFKPETNLAPPVEWEHPAKIPKLTRARAPVPYQAAQFARHPTDGAASSNVRVPFNALTSPRFRPRMLTTPVRPSGLLIRQAPQNQPSFTTIGKKQSNHSILISAAPRQAVPIHALNASNNAKGVVMCEICDGYIKDLEQLRNHMQWIHKVKIHPKMIYNRPPLNCQKCQFRFFTDQGLERHLLGSHGLVTSAIQDAANKGKDAGRCPVCGRAYQRKLLAHVSRDHNLILKPAHLSYKCTVCTATFGMYRQFENHVYSAHSVVAKKAVEKKAAPAKENANDAAVQQLKNSEDITITPQPVKIGAAKEK